MFSFKVAQEFRRRTQAAAPFPRGLVSLGVSGAAAGSALGRGPLAAVAAVFLGGVLMVANLSAARKEAVVVEAPAVTTAAPVVAAAVAKPLPPAPAPAPVESVAAAKTTARVDMTPTGALPSEASPKPHRKPHVVKKKAVDAKR